jgi:hypothetical protein
MRQKPTKSEKPDFTESDLLEFIEQSLQPPEREQGEYTRDEMRIKFGGSEWALKQFITKNHERISKRRINGAWYYRLKPCS